MQLKSGFRAAMAPLMVLGAATFVTAQTGSPSSKEAERCTVHRQILKRDTVPVRYGLIRFPNGYSEARQNLFPNARKVVLGGCVVGRMGKEQEVSYCQDCRDAQAKWERRAKVAAPIVRGR